MIRTAVLTTALSVLILTSDVAANDKCFCPVDRTGGKCPNSSRKSSQKYKALSTHPYFGTKRESGIAKCKAACAEESECEGYAWNAEIEFDPDLAHDASKQGGNCHLYDCVPGRLWKQSRNGKKDFTGWS